MSLQLHYNFFWFVFSIKWWAILILIEYILYTVKFPWSVRVIELKYLSQILTLLPSWSFYTSLFIFFLAPYALLYSIGFIVFILPSYPLVVFIPLWFPFLHLLPLPLSFSISFSLSPSPSSSPSPSISYSLTHKHTLFVRIRRHSPSHDLANKWNLSFFLLFTSALIHSLPFVLSLS